MTKPKPMANKIRAWSYDEPGEFLVMDGRVYKVENTRTAEIEPEFGILQQCWVYIFELSLANNSDCGHRDVERVSESEKLAKNKIGGFKK